VTERLNIRSDYSGDSRRNSTESSVSSSLSNIRNEYNDRVPENTNTGVALHEVRKGTDRSSSSLHSRGSVEGNQKPWEFVVSRPNSNVLVTTSKQNESSSTTSTSDLIPENLMNSEHSPAVRSSAQQFCSKNNDANMTQNALNTSNSCRLAGERETIKSLKANRTNSTAQKKKRERQRVSIESDLSTSELHVSKLSTHDSNAIPDPDSNSISDPDSNSIPDLDSNSKPDPNSDTDTVPGPDLEPDFAHLILP